MFTTVSFQCPPLQVSLSHKQCGGLHAWSHCGRSCSVLLQSTFSDGCCCSSYWTFLWLVHVNRIQMLTGGIWHRQAIILPHQYCLRVPRKGYKCTYKALPSFHAFISWPQRIRSLHGWHGILIMKPLTRFFSSAIIHVPHSHFGEVHCDLVS